MQHTSPREIVTSLNKRSQVTVPAEVRRALGLKLQDKVAFAIDGSRVRLLPAKFSVASAYGSVQPPTRTEELDAHIRQAKTDKAEQT